MSEKKEENEFSRWFSSYGLITAERVLGKYHIRLDHKDLFTAVKNTNSIFYKFLRVPIKHILNGIILGQAKEYHIYGQKLFIDYLLSGEGSKDEHSPGSRTREDIEEKRVEFIKLGELLQTEEGEHLKLISESQKYLMTYSKKWADSMAKIIERLSQRLKEKGVYTSNTHIQQAILHALANAGLFSSSDAIRQDFLQHFANKLDIKKDTNLDELVELFSDFFAEFHLLDEQMETFLDKAKAKTERFRELRAQFYDEILLVTTMLNNLSDYRINEEQIKVNKQALNFDKNVV